MFLAVSRERVILEGLMVKAAAGDRLADLRLKHWRVERLMRNARMQQIATALSRHDEDRVPIVPAFTDWRDAVLMELPRRAR